VHAGLAKITQDWLIEALPLKIWLPAKEHLPLIGPMLAQKASAWIFSWIGCLYDLTIPFLLWNRRTRFPAYITVLIFHGLTAWMFPIGVFPWVMAAASLLFLEDRQSSRILQTLRLPLPEMKYQFMQAWRFKLLIVFLAIQMLMPWRFLLYPGSLNWTEQGYRFSWRVMLVEKHGMAEFMVRDTQGRSESIRLSDWLTPNQIKQMSFQPDMILEFAHHLGKTYAASGWNKPSVFAEVWVTLNGRPARLLCDPETDLLQQTRNIQSYAWINH